MKVRLLYFSNVLGEDSLQDTLEQQQIKELLEKISLIEDYAATSQKMQQLKPLLKF